MRLAGLYAALSLAGCAPASVSHQTSFDGSDYTTNAEKIAHGERLANILSCKGCHSNDLTGGRYTDDLPPGLYASNLTRDVPNLSDHELERVIRGGVRPNGGDIWMMPSEAFQYLSDRDVDALIAFLRTLPPSGEPLPRTNIPPAIAAALHRDRGSARERLARARENPPLDLGGEHEFGRHLAMVVCAKCHESDLSGQEGFSPDLLIAGAYSRDQLTTLLTNGEAIGGRDIGMMGLVGSRRFSQLTSHERSAIVDYVLARAKRPSEE